MESKLLTQIISNYIGSLKHEMAKAGTRYYLTDNDIRKRQFHYWSRNKKHKDEYRSNAKIPTNFLKTIIDQKVSYCLGKDIVINNFEPSFDINEELYYTAETASQQSVGWLYIYVKEDQLKQKTMGNDSVMIPVYDETIEKNLVSVIRAYQIGEDCFAEIWSSETVEEYKKDKQSGLYEFVLERTHLENNISWGKIPFIQLKNNKYESSDLVPIKDLIDSYDIIISDFVNNFVDFQEVILMIKNYAENVSTEEAAAEFMEFLKKHKVINVKDNGDVEVINKEIPHIARSEFLSILRKLIFLFSQAVDIDELAGSNLTNVNIKARFSMLDQKANLFIKEIKKAVYELLWFSNQYNLLKNKTGQVGEISKAEIIINKSQIINESEIIDDCVKQADTGILSRNTNVSNNPWVKDTEVELKLIDEDEWNNSGDGGDGDLDD